MKILFVGAKNDRSEAAFFRELVRLGHDISILCEPNNLYLNKAFPNAEISITYVTFGGRISPRGIRIIRSKLKAGAFDIVHTLTNRALSNTLLASLGRPRLKLVAYRGTVGHLGRFDPASWMTYLNPNISRIVCLSNAVRTYLLSLGIPASRLVTVYKGVDPAWYTGASRPDLAPFGLSPDAFAVAFAGSMRPVKGVDILLQSLLHLPETSPIRLLLIGDVRDERLHSLAQDSRIRHRVHFTGFRDDAPALVGACHAFVMPSLAREGLCRAVMEAMAQGVPPVVSRVGGMPELVADRDSGLVVPPGDPIALAHALRFLAQSPGPRQTMGLRARERIVQHFDVATMVNRTLDLYRTLMDTHRP